MLLTRRKAGQLNESALESMQVVGPQVSRECAEKMPFQTAVQRILVRFPFVNLQLHIPPAVEETSGLSSNKKISHIHLPLVLWLTEGMAIQRLSHFWRVQLNRRGYQSNNCFNRTVFRVACLVRHSASLHSRTSQATLQPAG